ncbi:MAG: TraR/DksA C4-type zinc finger protein [Kangiellaceae bacterium]|nr:TraR/DksA C4-type zinc finger protein [Kangiellaceae bacterium]MCW9018610.1 TraR/DksA C4-type zinc finger protein [Kangiellaceae bacterium]
MSALDDLRKDLENRKVKLESRVTAIDADVSHKNQPLSNDWAEQAVERENEEVLEALGNASLAELQQIKAALKRMDQGTYQQCDVCGEDILIERLRLVPHTTHCTRCAEEIEASQ